ncbi:MAG: FecR domain-containing protein [Algibacter sp.]
MSPKIEKIIVKYITKSATASDLDTLSEWIKTPANKIAFKDYIQTHYAITYSVNNPDAKKSLERLFLRIKKEKTLVYRLKKQPIYRYVAAAVVVGLMVSTFFFENSFFNSSVESIPTIVNRSTIVPGTDKATLTLGDGTIVALEKGNNYQIKNANSNGEKIIYEANNKKTKEIVYNHLTIPRGGQFHLVLEDGTEVWLNSESQLKYPVSFTDDATREVELVYGEAYFEVSPSTNHKGAKFKLLNKSQEIEVLGTAFNVKAYKDETNIYTTLVEGKVAVSNAVSKQNLIPNQQLNLDLKNNSITVYKVDVSSEISWIKGVFSFKGKSLKDIMKVISRWYDVDIIFENKDLESIKFKGSLDKNQSIEEILTIMKSNTINNYEIVDKTIILK